MKGNASRMVSLFGIVALGVDDCLKIVSESKK